MRSIGRWGVVALVVGVGVLGASRGARPAGRDALAPADAAADIAALRAEIEQLKGRLPDQSHVMKDVGYHFANLWFAGRAGNWPLAGFYLAETRSHLRWAVRVIPVRKTKAGDVDLRTILDGLERTVFADAQRAVEGKSPEAFARAYQAALAGCYSCHVASDKPFLRPHVPTEPEARIIDFAPAASGQ